MNTAEISGALVDAGATAAVIVAILGAFAAITRTPPARYVWRWLVSEPIAKWQTATISDALAPMREAMDADRDVVVQHMHDELAVREADAKERDHRQDELDSWRTEIRADVTTLNRNFVGLHRRLDRTLEAIASGKPVTLSGGDEVDSDG